MSLLKTKDMDLFETQKQTLKTILDEKRKTGEIQTDEAYTLEYNTLLQKIESGEPLLQAREQVEETDADSFNDNHEEFQIDMMTVFSQINQVDQTVNKHQQLNQGIINNLKLTIKKVRDELARYDRMADFLSSEEVVTESFRDSNSIEQEETIYTERDGTQVTVASRAKHNINREALTLPTVYTFNKLIGNSGIRLGSIEITKQLGGGLIRVQNPENTIDKAVDISTETFWSESILVDSPIKVELGSEFFDISRGAVCELLITFDTVSQVNELSFMPFTEFPMHIVAVQSYETDDADEIPKEIISPTLASKGLGSAYASEIITYQFQDVQAKRMRIILNQIHYVKTDFVADDKSSEQLTLWFASKEDTHPAAVIEETKWYYNFRPLYANKAEHKRGFHFFSRAVRGINTDLDEIINNNEKTSGTAISKYAYNYGLYNLGVTQNGYHNAGVYISTPMDVKGNIKSITLETDELHPVVADNIAPFTDVEYYITNMENPNVNEWYAVLPENKARIESELLYPKFKNGKYRATLRFLPDLSDTILVRKDGVGLVQALGQFVVDGQDIILPNYDPSCYYNIAYKPDASAYEVDFIEKHTVGNVVVPNRSVEEFHGTNQNGEVTLNYYPFADKAKLNQQATGWNPSYLNNAFLPIKVKIILPSGFHIDQPFSELEKDTVIVENKTNYFNTAANTLDPFNPETFNYQYIVDGKTILFNTRIPEGARIIVEYQYIIGRVRMKAILRRTINYFYGLSPILNEYTLKYQRLL